MAERSVEKMLASSGFPKEKGSSRWKKILKYGVIAGVGLALVLAAL